MSLTDKELKDLANKGVFDKAVKTRAIKLHYVSLIQIGTPVTQALQTTSVKFGLSSRHIQRVIFNK